MPKAKFYVRVDTYWQGSQDTWIGPYRSKLAASDALDASGAGRADLSQRANDMHHQVRSWGIYNTTESYKAGRSQRNTIPAQKQIPGTIEQLAELEEREGAP